MKAYITIIGHEDEVHVKEVKSIDGTTVVFNDGSAYPCHLTASAFHYWANEEDARAACLLMAQTKRDTLAFYANTMKDMMTSMKGISIDNIQLVQRF